MRRPRHVDVRWLDVVQDNWEHQRWRFTPSDVRQLLHAVDELAPGGSDIPTAPLYMAMTPAELRQRLLEGDNEAGWEIATRHAYRANQRF